MSTQENMFASIEQWLKSGMTKKQFLIDKDFSEPKFNYWISKWKLSQDTNDAGFQPITLPVSKSEKVLEISTPGGLKIIVFA
jgi:hypothetical protein